MFPAEIYKLIAEYTWGAYRSLVCCNKWLHESLYTRDRKLKYSITIKDDTFLMPIGVLKYVKSYKYYMVIRIKSSTTTKYYHDKRVAITWFHHRDIEDGSEYYQMISIICESTQNKITLDVETPRIK